MNWLLIISCALALISCEVGSEVSSGSVENSQYATAYEDSNINDGLQHDVRNNLSNGAGSDGSGKASGTSYRSVRDRNMDTYWSPKGITGRISIKWSSAQTISSIVIREHSSAEGNIGNWKLVNNDNSVVLASGNGAGTINFSTTSLHKINFVIKNSNGTPRVAEFETYGSSTVSNNHTPDPTLNPSDSSSVTIEENTAGFCRVDGEVENNHTGYQGSGFSNTFNSAGNAVVYQVQAPAANNYSVRVRFANSGGSVRSAIMLINGNTGSAVTYSLSAAEGWSSWFEETQDVVLTAGTNRIELIAESGSGLPNIDHIVITGTTVTPDCSDPSNLDTTSNPETTPAPNPNLNNSLVEGYGRNTTGGQGGSVVVATTGTQINEAICSRPNKDTPLIIYVDGTINHGNTSTASGSCDTKGDEIQIKKVSNISLIGVRNRGVLDQIGIHILEANNIIIRNLWIRNVKKSGSPISNGGDAIGIENKVRNIWIDHNTLEASGGEIQGYDSLLDMKKNTQNVTVSYNHFKNSSRGGLVGSSDNDDQNTNITFHHNWYENIKQRTPLLRHGTAHTYNNYWSNLSNSMMHGISSRMGAQILVEGNYFYRSNNPLFYRILNTVSASADSDQPGCWETNGDNTLDEATFSRSVGNGAPVAPQISHGQMQSTCRVSVPYAYNLDRSANVPGIVQANSGHGVVD